MKIEERKALNTQKPNTDKVYETNTNVSPRTAKPASSAGQDGVALDSQDQLRLQAMTPTADENSRVARLTQLVQSGQYQVDHLALAGAMVAAMLKGY
jgi:anti-sigma28 factor (negative regulator of flagellin synthesis)